MTRVMIAVDGSELDAPLAATARRRFGADAGVAATVGDPAEAILQAAQHDIPLLVVGGDAAARHLDDQEAS